MMTTTTSRIEASIKKETHYEFEEEMDSDKSSVTSGTPIATPTTSTSGDTVIHDLDQPTTPPLTMPPAWLPLARLDVSNWRTPYPKIGQFAMAPTEEIIAAGPSGLFYFKRIQDHPSKPWSEPHGLPKTQAVLNQQSVSGLTIHSHYGNLHVYCVAGGVLYSFFRIGEHGSFMTHPSPLSTWTVSGTPAVASLQQTSIHPQRLSLVVPCQAGGLLHVTMTYPSSASVPYFTRPGEWGPVDHVAKQLGVISAISIAVKHDFEESWVRKSAVYIVAVVIAGARLHTVEGAFGQEYDSCSRPCKWDAQAPTRINHPGEVSGNPMLIKDAESDQLDLLVPSAEGGVFHFVRTKSAPNEWHMIARITLPQGLPIASCLSFYSFDVRGPDPRQFRAVIQSGGQLYYLKSHESPNPWVGSQLKPIMMPGPFHG
ncbi:hypothetical protein F5Y12DRAFT_799983 [Xylaria sp. FL1777]|nr:hypothetical protein F5Y12DRAFT_799983 [Xylaria sp. FL1777]